MRPTRLVTVAGMTAALALGTVSVAAAAPRSHELHALRAGHVLVPGQALVSPNHRYSARLTHNRIVVTNRHGHRIWASPRAARGSVLRVGRFGQLKLTAHHRTQWAAGTARSGNHDVLRVLNSGVLALTARGGDVWTSQWRDGCHRGGGRLFVVDISRQLARACSHGQQQRVTPVTTGAVDLGEGTPLGTWHVQAKVRNTTLYPAAGGAYPVKFWVPYDGAYGIHDSPWQTFPYGSPRYKRDGSHGCVHVPGPMMSWLFSWVRIGTTTVTIHR
jgi:hypothetical protein